MVLKLRVISRIRDVALQVKDVDGALLGARDQDLMEVAPAEADGHSGDLFGPSLDHAISLKLP